MGSHFQCSLGSVFVSNTVLRPSYEVIKFILITTNELRFPNKLLTSIKKQKQNKALAQVSRLVLGGSGKDADVLFSRKPTVSMCVCPSLIHIEYIIHSFLSNF